MKGFDVKDLDLNGFDLKGFDFEVDRDLEVKLQQSHLE